MFTTNPIIMTLLVIVGIVFLYVIAAKLCFWQRRKHYLRDGLSLDEALRLVSSGEGILVYDYAIALSIGLRHVELWYCPKNCRDNITSAIPNQAKLVDSELSFEELQELVGKENIIENYTITTE